MNTEQELKNLKETVVALQAQVSELTSKLDTATLALREHTKSGVVNMWGNSLSVRRVSIS